jgi:single-strand DNA-binding protein
MLRPLEPRSSRLKVGPSGAGGELRDPIEIPTSKIEEFVPPFVFRFTPATGLLHSHPAWPRDALFSEGSMPSFNSVTLLGNLTRDPELRYTPQGVAVCEFALAVNRRFTKKGGEQVDEVAYVDVVCWNRLAEVAADFLVKGRAVLLLGRLVQDRWEDESSGQKRSKIRVVAEILQFLGSGSKDDAPSTPETVAEEAPAPEAPAVAAAPTKGNDGAKPAKARR